MNFLREHAWMAPIGNFAVGTLALAVAVLVNKAKLKECLKDHWKLLAVIFGTAGIYLFYLNGWLEWLQGVRDWFVKRIEIPIWALCLDRKSTRLNSSHLGISY